MNTPSSQPQLFESHECPVVDGHRQVQRLAARIADVGGIPIHRVLPQRARRTVGAWCFADHAGPSPIEARQPGMRVGPHPHIGLQTFTWMISGEVLHRDSLGHVQEIRPGELNLMTAGRGIAHTEESVPGSTSLHAAQLWIALPFEHRNTDPRFDHYENLPHWVEQGVEATLLMGDYAGHRAPALAFSPLLGMDLTSRAPRALSLPVQADFEYGVLVLDGQLTVGSEIFVANEMAYFGCGIEGVNFDLGADTRVLLLGGRPLGEEILIWWNFVGHSREDIVQAQADWEAESDRFGPVHGYVGKRLLPPPIPWAH
ncbi:MAG TPA: pirin family protein [Castellaniella sp.]|uniref:pirin family protein n=1 Tax=Castellaniella sp. TaxID=1955812 RepID=UPI002EF94AB5